MLTQFRLYVLCHNPHYNSNHPATILLPILQIRRLRHTEVNNSAKVLLCLGLSQLSPLAWQVADLLCVCLVSVTLDGLFFRWYKVMVKALESAKSGLRSWFFQFLL